MGEVTSCRRAKVDQKMKKESLIIKIKGWVSGANMATKPKKKATIGDLHVLMRRKCGNDKTKAEEDNPQGKKRDNHG